MELPGHSVIVDVSTLYTALGWLTSSISDIRIMRGCPIINTAGDLKKQAPITFQTKSVVGWSVNALKPEQVDRYRPASIRDPAPKYDQRDLNVLCDIIVWLYLQRHFGSLIDIRHVLSLYYCPHAEYSPCHEREFLDRRRASPLARFYRSRFPVPALGFSFCTLVPRKAIEN